MKWPGLGAVPVKCSFDSEPMNNHMKKLDMTPCSRARPHRRRPGFALSLGRSRRTPVRWCRDHLRSGSHDDQRRNHPGATAESCGQECHGHQHRCGGILGRQCVKLSATGHYVEFSALGAANAMVVRCCVPDTADGIGADYTISLYINGTFVRKIPVTSKLSWLYGGYTFSNNPEMGLRGISMTKRV